MKIRSKPTDCPWITAGEDLSMRCARCGAVQEFASPTNCPWITAGEDLSMRCARCGAVQEFASPINLDMWIAAGKVFRRLHRRCHRKPEASKP